MSYRPHTEEERARITKQIAVAEKSLAKRLLYIDRLNAILDAGVWYSGDTWEDVPMPRPHCYLCVNGSATFDCELGHEYGKPCGDYMHIMDNVKDHNDDNVD